MQISIYSGVGNYNFLNPSEVSFHFVISIKDAAGNIIKDENRPVRAKLEYFGDKEEEAEDFLSSDFSNIDEAIFKCFSKGPRDQKENFLFFMSIFIDHREELLNNFIAQQKKKIEEEIKELQEALEDLSFSSFPVCSILTGLLDKIKILENWISSEEEKRSQYKEGSKVYEESSKHLSRYRQDRETYKDLVEKLKTYSSL